MAISQSQLVHQISKTSVKPSQPIKQPKLCNLTPWDLSMLSLHYIQSGLLFTNLPHSLHTGELIDKLKTSLSAALSHFYPLTGRLVTEKHDDNSLSISINCNDEHGAEFVHAVAYKLTVDSVLAASGDVPGFVPSFFPYYGVVNYDGHFLPLLAVQLTELCDGVFLGCSMNHVVADGAAYWNFLCAWSKISRLDHQEDIVMIHRPIHDRWIIDDIDPPVKLPFSSPDQFIIKYALPPSIRSRIFHFSSQSVARLKLIANAAEDRDSSVSSFQALCSLVWRSVTRARRPQPDQTVTCRLASDDRSKLRPPLSPDYFGNFVTVIGVTAKAGDLLGNRLGWGARLVQQRVLQHGDGEIRSTIRASAEAPVILSPSKNSPLNVSVVNSPRFPVYECDFGWGRAACVRSGSMFKADGAVAVYPGGEGGGSVDVEVCLVAETMEALEFDEEFMTAASQQ